MEKHELRGSNSYIWSGEDILGHGSMGHVYVARHRRSGDKYAVKMFKQELKLMSKDYMQIELDVLKHIPDHENVIKIVDVEIQHHTQDKVIIMEYCDGGSLQDILSKPENYFGLREEEFLSVFFQIGNAVCHLHEHGIVHRDIKPGNILISISPDGSHVYKITDFGTSVYCDKENLSFRSLAGTEEYLHPDLLRDIFINKKSEGDYDAHVDLWSFGVTIYHCATGNFPFVPMSGIKNDRHKMQSLTRHRDPDVISQREMPDKSILSSKHLPDKCYLTSGTKRKTEEFLVKLFDLTTRIKTTEFAQKLRRFQEQHHTYLFDAGSGLVSTFYINRSAKLHDLKHKISGITGVPVDALQLFSDYTLLDGNEDRTISQWLRTSKDKPLMVLSQLGHSTASVARCSETDLHIELPDNTSDDVMWAREICGTMYFLEYKVKDYVTTQEHMARLERLLQISSESRLTLMRTTYNNLQSMLELIEFFKEQHPDKLDHNILQLDETRKYLHDLDKLMCQSMSTDRNYPICQQSRCWHKARKIVQDSEVLMQSISDRKRIQISHNENELNKYNKSELRRKYRYMKNLLCRHCCRKTSQVHSKLQEPIKRYESIVDAEKEINARIEKLKYDRERSSGIQRRSTTAIRDSILCADTLKKCEMLAEDVIHGVTENTELMKLLEIS